MADYDDSAYNGRIEALREKEYPMLKGESQNIISSPRHELQTDPPMQMAIYISIMLGPPCMQSLSLTTLLRI